MDFNMTLNYPSLKPLTREQCATPSKGVAKLYFS